MWPQKLSDLATFCPLLKCKVATKNPYISRVWGLLGHFPTFIPLSKCDKKYIVLYSNRGHKSGHLARSLSAQKIGGDLLSNNKITWRMVFEDFKTRLPNLAKEVVDYRPHGYLEIQVWLKDGTTMSWDYLQKKATIIKAIWANKGPCRTKHGLLFFARENNMPFYEERDITWPTSLCLLILLINSREEAVVYEERKIRERISGPAYSRPEKNVPGLHGLQDGPKAGDPRSLSFVSR